MAEAIVGVPDEDSDQRLTGHTHLVTVEYVRTVGSYGEDADGYRAIQEVEYEVTGLYPPGLPEWVYGAAERIFLEHPSKYVT